jgi:hypothetical protein
MQGCLRAYLQQGEAHQDIGMSLDSPAFRQGGDPA